MSYNLIQPPFSLKFREMSKKELSDYFLWLQNIIPQRLCELAKAAEETPGFETWVPKFTPASLEQLGEWFATQVDIRPRSEQEIQDIAGKSPHPMEIANKELTNRTFSLAMDVGIYLSQVFLKNHPQLRWEQPLSSKKFVDYGQPVLVEFGPAPLNPVRMVVTLAYGIAAKTKTGADLRKIYDIWSPLIRP